MPPYTQEYDVELSLLAERVIELLGDESLQNTAGINMWLGWMELIKDSCFFR